MPRGLTRSWRVALRVLVVVSVLFVSVLGPAMGAAAFTVNLHLCDSALDAGFTDVPAESPHKADIDCLLYWGVTNQTGTYDPTGVVSRWQMALFMVRSHGAFGEALPDGSDQGFTDIASLLPEYQTAINQLKQLNVTAGTSPTTFSPEGSVTRGQMALFLTRLVTAASVTLPTVVPSGFGDIGELPPATQDAIAQLKTLGVTKGTSPTTFGPDETVTREQMASFIVRTLKITWRFNTLRFVTECSGSAPEVCTDPDTIWDFDAIDGVIVLRHGWAFDALDPTDDPNETLEVRYLINGVLTPAQEVRTELDGIIYRSWVLIIQPGDTPATFQLETRWIRPSLGGHVLSTILTLSWPRPEPNLPD